MRNKRVSGGAIAGSIIISVIMTIVLFFTTSALIVNRIFTEKFVSSVIGSVKDMEIPITIDDKEYNNVSEAIYGVIEESMNEANVDVNIETEDSNISQEEIEEFIEESGIEDLLAEKLGVGMEAVLNGEDVALLTEDDIMDFVEDNQEIIEDTFEVEITEEMKNDLREEIKQSEITDTFTTGAITEVLYEEENNPLAPVLNAVRTLFSTPVIIAGYVIVLLMFLGVFFINKRQLWYAGPYLGIPATIVGVGVTITSLLVKGLVSLAEEEMGAAVSVIAEPLHDLMLEIGVIYILIGVVAIIVSAVVKSALERNEIEEQGTQEVI